MAVLMMLWISASCMNKGADFGTSVCSTADGSGREAHGVGLEECGRLFGHKGALERRDKDVVPCLLEFAM